VADSLSAFRIVASLPQRLLTTVGKSLSPAKPLVNKIEREQRTPANVETESADLWVHAVVSHMWVSETCGDVKSRQSLEQLTCDEVGEWLK
jgi:hypothetical protein